MQKKLSIWGIIILLIVLHPSLGLANAVSPIQLDGTFINAYQSLPGSDYETKYQAVNMRAPNYYHHSVRIDLSATVSGEIKQPLQSKIKDAQPYYGIWLYGGANKIPLMVSVVQIDEAEVPQNLLSSIRPGGYGPEAKFVFFKIVLDLNRDNDFTNDEAAYYGFEQVYYHSGQEVKIKIPVIYKTQGEVSPQQERSYSLSVQLKRQPAFGMSPASYARDISGLVIPEFMVIQGKQAFQADINFGGEMIKIWLIDRILNGVWDTGDLWAVDLSRDGEWDINSRFSVEKFRLDEAVNIGGVGYLLAWVNPATETLKISRSQIEVKPREIFGVGSKAPAFVIRDLLTRKMVTSLDLKGRPYVIYYFPSFYEQQHSEGLKTAINLMDKYLGLNNIALLIAFDNVNFERIMNTFPPGDLPYYVIKARYDEYDSSGQQKHLLHGFQIDPYALQNRRVVIAVDGAGCVISMSKDAGLEQIIELCEVLQPGSTQEKTREVKKPEKKGKKTLWNLFGLLARKKPEVEISPTPTPEARLETIISEERPPRSALDWFKQHLNIVDRALTPGRIFYQAGASEGHGVHSKSFGKDDAIRLPGVNHISSSFPRLSQDRKTLYMKIYDRNDNSFHILALTAGEEPEELISIKSNIVYYDISPDKTEIAYSKKEGDLYHIFRQRLDGSPSVRISADEIGGVFPSYSPDGKWIACCARKKLRLYNIETGEEKILVDDNLTKELPEWSPDGKWIVYQASAGDEFSYDIHKVTVATGEVLRLTREPGIDANPCFSSDGSKIIFMSERETGNNNQTLFVMNANGDEVKRDITAKTGLYFPRW